MIYALPNIPEPLSRAICANLIGNLPRLAEDTPDQRALRDERAITALARYIPENAAEAERYRRQHALMMRTMHSGLRALLRTQTERHKAGGRETPHRLLRAGHLHSGTLPPEPQPPPCPPAVAPEPQPAARPKYEDMTEAEQYAVTRPDRAAAIRHHGGMPPGAKYPPPDDAIITEIVTSDSPVFLALDAQRAADAAT